LFGSIFRKAKKGISPVVATALLLVVAVMSVVGFQGWFTAFSSSVFVGVESDTDSSNSVKVEDIIGDKLYLNSKFNSSINSININGVDCNFNGTVSGIDYINISSCIENISGAVNIVVETGDKIIESYDYVQKNNNPGVVSLDSSPDVFNFIDLSNLDLNNLTYSNFVLPVGFDPGTAISISGDGNPQFSINGDSYLTSSVISVGDNLVLRANSSNISLGSNIISLTLGDYTTTWNITSKYVPDVFDAVDYTIDWAKHLGGTGNDFLLAMELDSNDNILFGGWMSSTANFRFSDGSIDSAFGNKDAFFNKVDKNGNLIKKKIYGGTGDDLISSIFVNSDDSYYLSGNAEYGSISLASNDFTFSTSTGNQKAYYLNFDNGNLGTASKYVSTSVNLEQSKAIYSDSPGNIYSGVIGKGAGVDFGNGVTAATNANPSPIIVKFNSGGVAQWAKAITASNDNFYIHGIVGDSSGNIYIEGRYGANSVTFWNGTVVNNPNPGTDSTMVFKVSPSGNLLWYSTYNYRIENTDRSIVLDSDENLLIAGYFSGTLNIDGTSHTGTDDMVILKFDSSDGDVVWSRSYSMNGDDTVNSIAVDPKNNIFVSFTSSSSPFNLTGESFGANNYAAYVAKLNATGSPLWSEEVWDSNHYDFGMNVKIDSEGSIYLGGLINADVTIGGTPFTRRGGYDIVIVKLVPVMS